MKFLQQVTNKSAVFFGMIKFEHSIFALPFAYLGLILAEGGWPSAKLFWGVTVAMVSFRTMAMGANRLLDAEIDARNPRTSGRALPKGLLSRPFVWGACILSLIIFEFSAAWLGPLCFQLSPVVVVLAWAYPLLKRFTWFSHLVLGMILGIAPYGAWLASRGAFSWTPGWIMIGVTAWVSGFDLIYALQDLDFDRKAGLHSFPARFGYTKTIFVTRVLHLLTLVCWFLAGWTAGLGWIYFLGLGLAAVFLFAEHWIIRAFGLAKMNEAFFTMNAVISVAVFGFALGDLLIGRMAS